jgi:hypothetical protein
MLPRYQQQVVKFDWTCPYRRSIPLGIESNPNSPALELHKDRAPAPRTRHRNSGLTNGSGIIRLRGIVQTELKTWATRPNSDVSQHQVH